MNRNVFRGSHRRRRQRRADPCAPRLLDSRVHQGSSSRTLASSRAAQSRDYLQFRGCAFTTRHRLSCRVRYGRVIRSKIDRIDCKSPRPFSSKLFGSCQSQNKQALLAEPVTESVEAQHAVQKTTPLLTASAKSATTDMSGEKPREEERILVVIQGRGGGDILEMAGVSRWWGEGV